MTHAFQHAIVLCAVALSLRASAALQPAEDEASSPREALAKEADALRPLMQSRLAKNMLDAVASLPAIEPRTVFFDAANKVAYRSDQTTDIAPETLAGWKKIELDEQYYYTTRYGSLLASTRAFDLAAAASPSLNETAGKRIADFGYGTIGQLRLLASLRAHAVGIEVDPVLNALYSFDGDTGIIPPAHAETGSPPGSIKLVHGHWPADEAVAAAVGTGFDLFISKNTLKRGYIHPEREVDPRMLVQLKVDDETFTRRVFELLNPGGVAIIYNISPARSKPDEPYKPWSDGSCPFDRELLEKVGFEVVKYDEDDTAFVKTMAKALGWDEAMDIESDLFAHYTLLRKPKS